MRYEVWVLDNCNKAIIMKNYTSYKIAKSVAKIYASQKDALKVVIFGREDLKDEEPDLL